MTLYALCAGVSDYSQWRTIGWNAPDLPYSIKNAEDFAQILISGFGADPANVGIQRDSWCSSGNFLSAFSDLVQRARPGDSICLFFSGHGTRLQGPPSAGKPSDLWYDALVPYAGSLVSDYDLSILTNSLDASKVSLTVVLDTAYVGGQRPVPGAPQPVGIALTDAVQQDFMNYCHTIVPVGLCLQNPMATIAGNTSAIHQDIGGRLAIEFADSGHQVDIAKTVILSACAPDEIAWQISDPKTVGLQNSVFVAAWKALVAAANGPVSMSNQDLLAALRTQADQLMTQYVRRMASYAKMTQVPQIYGPSSRLSQNVLSASAAGISG
jgi:hypothetical protein